LGFAFSELLKIAVRWCVPELGGAPSPGALTFRGASRERRPQVPAHSLHVPVGMESFPVKSALRGGKKEQDKQCFFPFLKKTDPAPRGAKGKAGPGSHLGLATQTKRQVSPGTEAQAAQIPSLAFFLPEITYASQQKGRENHIVPVPQGSQPCNGGFLLNK